MDSVDHLIALLTPIEVPATLGRYNRFSTDQTKIHGNLVGARLNFWQRCLTGRIELELYLRNSGQSFLAHLIGAFRHFIINLFDLPREVKIMRWLRVCFE